MEIKPMYDNTIKMSVTSVKLENIKERKKEVKSTIPNGILKVVKWEKKRQFFALTISSLLLLSSIIIISLYLSVLTVSWLAFVLPISISLFSLWKVLVTIIERNRMNKDIARYEEDLAIDLNSTPPFIPKMFRDLHLKQISHNWFTMFVLFYGGIITLLLWWLKDVNWWIFDFDQWVRSLFGNPTFMAILFTIGLIGSSLIHIIFAIQRKKKILDIKSYFGTDLMSEADIVVIKQGKNKTYRRLFVISLMVFLLIPIVVKLILKLFRKK